MPSYVVRYGVMRLLGLFSPRGNDRYFRGMKVIARTNRGLEAGEVLSEANSEIEEQLKNAPGGQIFREQTAEDINDLVHIHAKERTEFDVSKQHVERLQLPMQLVDVEHLFGGERLVIYYLSEDRVDFRELVKLLAGEFQTRIEMRQIGVRDEAKLLADYGDCGKPVCCNSHLLEMPPVSMRMAKVQKATLDPTKISGRCGRLKCCLRYEFDTYEELLKEMPPPGSDLVTKTGRARVLGQEILSQQLLVSTEDNRRVLIPLSDVVTVLRVGGGPRGPEDEGEGQETGGRPPRGEGHRNQRFPRSREGQPAGENPPRQGRPERGPPPRRNDQRRPKDRQVEHSAEPMCNEQPVSNDSPPPSTPPAETPPEN